MLSFNFSPLAALVLGILIGFLIEWLLELLYFRRQRRGAEERLAQAESDLQERNRNLLALRTQADAARSDLATAQARVTSLQAELQACQAATKEARGQAATLQTQLHDTTTQVSGLQSGRQEVDARLAAALGELEMLRAQVGDANARRDSLDAALQAREAAYKSLDAALAASRAHETALQNDLTSLRADFQARDTALGDAQGEVDSLRQQLNELGGRRDSLDAALQARDAAYRALEGDLAQSRTQEASLQEQLASLRADFQAQNAALDSAVAQEASLRSQLTGAAPNDLGAAAEKTANLPAELATGGEHGVTFAQELPAAGLVAGAGASFASSAKAAGDAGLGAETSLDVGSGTESVTGELPGLDAHPDTGVEFGQETPARGLPGLEAGLAAGAMAFGSASGQQAGVVACPQDLSKVQGVGQSYEAKLYAAGIGSFWELATAEDEELRRIFGIKSFQKIDLAAMKADARRLAEATHSIGRAWDGTEPDDFESMEGIGAVFEGRLYDAGICTNRALANATEEQLAEICPAPAWRRPNYADWILQARARLGEV